MKLSLVPTPIGNLEDASMRMIRTLREADLILAEDTRNTAFLLRHYQIETPLKSHHQHNEHKLLNWCVEQLRSGKHFALVSDAGTPGISDPGFLLVRACTAANILVECLPGPAAFVPALVASGLPSDRFVFEGFLPPKKGRSGRLNLLRNEDRTIIFYEAPHRITKFLEELIQHFGPLRKASLAREISKVHETFHRGTLMELLNQFTDLPPKGECILVVAGKENHKKQQPEKSSELL